MSVFGKRPFVSKVLNSCSATEIKAIHNLMNSSDSTTPTFISLEPSSSHPISSADKGISFVAFRLNDLLALTVTGILVYTDTECALFGQDNSFSGVKEFEINPTKRTYDQIYENLTVEELRRTVMDKMIEKGETVTVQADDIDSTGATQGQVLTADGEGGAEWGTNVGLTIEQIGSPSQLVVDGESEPKTAKMTFALTEEQATKVKSAKLVIFTMNNSFVLTPLAQNGDTLASQSFASDEIGDTMIARVRFTWFGNSLIINFDEKFAAAVYTSGITPYGLLLIAN